MHADKSPNPALAFASLNHGSSTTVFFVHALLAATTGRYIDARPP